MGPIADADKGRGRSLNQPRATSARPELEHAGRESRQLIGHRSASTIGKRESRIHDKWEKSGGRGRVPNTVVIGRPG
eukprot:5754139-Heterocapsa_arctica.AAC.1